MVQCGNNQITRKVRLNYTIEWSLLIHNHFYDKLRHSLLRDLKLPNEILTLLLLKVINYLWVFMCMNPLM